MSLNWQIDGIIDYETKCWIEEEDGGKRLNPVTETLIFGTMFVGLGSITNTNVDEFAARFRIMEKIHGAMLFKWEDGERKDWFLSDEDFIAHIGLAVNVTNETRAKWSSRIFVKKDTSITEEIARSFRRERAKKVAA